MLNLINTLVVFIVILIIQKLIDELKQRGIKNKKYLFFSLLLGIFIGFTIILGISAYLWGLIALMSLILTVNLDKTHLDFPKKIITFANQKIKDALYKVERININKLVFSIFVITILACIVSFIGRILVLNIDFLKESLVFNLNTGISNFNISNAIYNFVNNTKILLSTSRTYYILIFAYIVFIEVLAVVLHRRYDTKSTIMKLFFILLYISISIFDLNITNYQTILTVLLILISIVNTSNIYLNREERIKMLVA